MRSPGVSTTDGDDPRRASTTGRRATRPLARSAANSGPSESCSRTTSPTTTSTALTRKGSRQPQDRNAAGSVSERIRKNDPVASSIPAGEPIWVKLPTRPRRPGAACSAESTPAPPLDAAGAGAGVRGGAPRGPPPPGPAREPLHDSQHHEQRRGEDPDRREG